MKKLVTDDDFSHRKLILPRNSNLPFPTAKRSQIHFHVTNSQVVGIVPQFLTSRPSQFWSFFFRRLGHRYGANFIINLAPKFSWKSMLDLSDGISVRTVKSHRKSYEKPTVMVSDGNDRGYCWFFRQICDHQIGWILVVTILIHERWCVPQNWKHNKKSRKVKDTIILKDFFAAERKVGWECDHHKRERRKKREITDTQRAT